MPSRLIWLPKAIADVDRLRQFIRPYSPKAARRAARQVREAVRILLTYPEAGRPVEDPPGFRDLIVPFGARAYVLRYRLDEETIVVVRVWHGLEERN